MIEFQHLKIMELKCFPQLILKGDARLLSYRDGPQYRGNPDGLYFARDFSDISDLLRETSVKKIPVTTCGARTSITGSSNAEEGLLLAMERMNQVRFEENAGEILVHAQPGILLGQLKREIAQKGYFYPPDPTSFNEAQLGGTIATNATGEDTLLYGATRDYVMGLQVLDIFGEVHHFKRTKPANAPTKARAGYFLDGDEIDWFIGSEGTLGVITEITLRVLPPEPEYVALLVPLPSFASTLKVVQAILLSLLRPRALELIGPGAFEIFSEQEGVPIFPQGTACLLYLKQNLTPGQTVSQALEPWWLFFDGEKYLDDIFVAANDQQNNQLRQWRHYIPAKVNERAFPHLLNGGGKISTDWWVPTQHIEKFMTQVFADSQKLGVDFLAFAHIGNGHPHWNYLTKNTEEKNRVIKFVAEVCRKAVSLGGGVAGEHGIGKIHHDYLALQHPPAMIKRMRQLKQKWDPDYLLGRGNIFS